MQEVDFFRDFFVKEKEGIRNRIKKDAHENRNKHANKDDAKPNLRNRQIITH